MRILLNILLALSAVFTATADNLHDYVLTVGEFTRIKVTGDINVIYRNVPDSLGMVSFSAPDRMADAIGFRVKKGTLTISPERKDTGALPTVRVYSSFLSAVENEAGGTVSVYSPAPCPEFSARQIGNGHIVADNVNATEVSASLTTGNGSVTVTGATQQASATMLGAGTIDISCLSARDVSCKSVGSGSISCWARRQLSVRGIGSTRIYYRGEPEISKSGGARILPISAKD